MKKLLVMLLTLSMLISLMPASALALNEDDYDNQDIFSVNELTTVLSPGVDYYFDCEWQNGAITDDFFEFYTVSVSVSSAYDRTDRKDADYISSTTAKKMVEKAEFVKLDSKDKYYFHFKAKGNYSYSNDDATIKITILAKDNSRSKDRKDSRSWYEMDLDIGYGDREEGTIITKSQYEVDSDYPIVEFDDDLDYCRLDFEDGSYYSVRFSRTRKFNLGNSTAENAAIKAAYPSATFKFLTFYSRPSFAYESVLKVYAPSCNYLYEIGDNNSLTLLSSVNNGGYLGYTTSRLGAYVASSVALDAKKFAVSTGNYVEGSVQAPANSTVSSGSTVSPSVPSTTVPFTPGSTITNPPTGIAK